MLKAFVPTVQYMVLAAAKAVVSPDLYTALHRSAIFLILFLVVHMAGNLNAFLGAEALNGYAKKLNDMTVLPIVEMYLFLIFALHTVIAMILSWRKKKAIIADPFGLGILAISGTVVWSFVVVHVMDFRLADKTGYVFKFGSGDTGYDFYAMSVALFSSPLKVFHYCTSVLILCCHLWVGWPKTVIRMKFDRDSAEAARNLGRVMIVPVGLGFVSDLFDVRAARVVCGTATARMR
eukprot:g23063.t1